ncbi:hypothetical protein KA005_60475 [bacterium]|nr:hypothetical protein [bacterium]
MNREPAITRREQQEFVRLNGGRMLHFSIRSCPCDGVGCEVCGGKMKYYDDPVPLWGIITGGMNTKKKEAQFPTINKSSYKLMIEPRHRVARGDRITPFGMREFEQNDEVLLVSVPELTYIPINPRGVKISFISNGGGVINYEYPRDFTIEKEYYGKVPLYSKTIKFLADPPSDQERFSVRYEYIPDFEIDEIPVANMHQEQRLLTEIPLKKIIIGGQLKTKSHEQSSDAVRGMKYD